MSAPIAPTGRAGETRAQIADDEPPGPGSRRRRRRHGGGARRGPVGGPGSGPAQRAAADPARGALPRPGRHRPAHRRPNSPAPGGSPPWPTPSRGTAEPGVRASTEVVPGEPVDAPAPRRGGRSQLLVLGSSTTGAADEMVLATSAARVAARSPAPVVVVPRRRGPAAGRAARGGDPRRRRPGRRRGGRPVRRGRRQRSGVPLLLLQTRSAQQNVAASWVDDETPGRSGSRDLEVQRSELPDARGNQVLGAACPSPLLVISAGHGTLLHRSLDGPHLLVAAALHLTDGPGARRCTGASGTGAGRSPPPALTPRAPPARGPTGQDRRSWVPRWSTSARGWPSSWSS